MERNKEWDGRSPFYPPSGYELDRSEHIKYLEYCRREHLGHLFEESQQDGSEDESEEEDHDNDSGTLSRSIIYAPPVYDQNDHYHELHDVDSKYRCFIGSPGGRSLQNQAMFPQRMLKKEKWNAQLAREATNMILGNREEVESIKVALDASIVITARVTGLRGASPTRKFAVSGRIPLSILHDRILCPIFGWTRGYHDYRFIAPPSAYKDGPPKIPLLDIIFGAVSADPLTTSFMPKHGYYGTLRGDASTAPTVLDTVACVADLLYLPGHRLWHVLGQPGWKTELTVVGIDTEDNGARPLLVEGSGGSLPESFILGMDLSDWEDFDCGGPHAFALAKELIRRANQSDDAAWMKKLVLQSGATESDFDRTFALAASRKLLAKAWKGESTPNPEYSTDWVMQMFGSKSSIGARSVHDSHQRAGVCNFCQRTGERLQTSMKHCGRCKNVNYCSRDCQLKDWKSHKNVCYASGTTSTKKKEHKSGGR